MDPGLLQRYARPVPRYTSYPTAPNFHPGVTAATYRDWLRRIGEEAPVSLYLHVPFCARMCWFCGCHTKIVRRYRPVADYAALLGREVGLLAGAMASRPPVSHVHWGGGTPTILSDRDFAGLGARIRENFRLADDAEVAVEIDPRTLTEGMAAALAGGGVNRASLGVQDFNRDVQRAVNRIQPYDQTARVVGWLRDAGISAINLDLMYGLPRQTVADVVRTVDLAVRLRPDRLALFGYAHVPWMKANQRMIDESALPGTEARFSQAAAAAARLGEHGYRRIGLDHFAGPHDPMTRARDAGRLRRNFQGYTTDGAATLLGLGVSAIGTLAEGYVQNTVSARDYGAAIEDGRLAVVRGVRLGGDDRLRRTIIERLMCELVVDLGKACAESDAPDFAAELAALAPMQRDGLVEIDGNRVCVTEFGRPLTRSVCAVFDRYLDAGRGRHSQAV